MAVPPKHADVVIIGGGITGCATAYYLSKSSLSVVVLERGIVANEQSSRAWGFIRKQGRHEAEIPMAARSSAIWKGLSAELGADLEYACCGIMTPALNDRDEERIIAGAEQAAKCGLSTKLLSASEVKKLIPEMMGDWRGALFTPDDGHAEPRKVTKAFAEAASRNGARILENIGVTSIDVTNGAVVGVETSHGYIRTSAVLCAAGVGTPALVKALGVSLPIHPVRLSVLETEVVAAFTKLAVWSPKVSFRPTGRGTFTVGSGYRARAGDLDITWDAIRHSLKFLPQLQENPGALKFRIGWPLVRSLRSNVLPTAQPEPRVNPAIARFNLAQFQALFPHLGPVRAQRLWAGCIDATPDLIPIIDEMPGISNLHIAAGYSGHGFALGPVSGQILSDRLRGLRSEFDLSPFRIARFKEGQAKLSRNAL